MKRLAIVIISFLFAALYALPNLALAFAVLLAYYSKWVSGFFCFIFAYNVAKLVESKYIKYLKKEKEE